MDAHEIYVVTADDRNRQAAEIKKLVDKLQTQEQMVKDLLTLTEEEAKAMNTVSDPNEIDSTKCHALLSGLGSTYAVPVEPAMTVADIKLFISVKSGMPLDAIDIVTAIKHEEI